ncbi:outer membrane protein [Rhodopseudomonas palustris]|uniref:Outer membrane beta-barrel protein n=1 Tax=Rhodopseudomonas palustris TaxID=1076 RepID=A0AAX3DSK9_RHOPL|nr:outer membrane beta-barrel protein [Rhodopseudomonas palustris]UYO37857.1 outer membrane beta-barrel protein [Rhodopseudomonas palustris]UYO51887.1 outer membrane beta-barrel protein [Rhodopseudomonas palustris]
MKKFLLGTVGLIALGAAPAMAADLAARPYTKAPPIIAVAYDWSGFYIGANGGWGTSRKTWDLYSLGGLFVGPDGSHDASGGTVGGQIGYRWQIGSWVVGLEAQGNWADFKGSNTGITSNVLTNQSRIDAFGLFTAQVGYAWNNALLYVKGGAAVVSDKYDTYRIATGVGFDSGKETRWGGSIGTGLEYGFAPNWSVGVEYNHLFLDSRDVTFATAGGVQTVVERIKQDADVVTARINYRWGGPIVARY